MAELIIDPGQIGEALRRNLKGWDPSLEAAAVGYVATVGDGVARVHGLPGTMANELLEFPSGLLGVALNLDEDSVGTVILGEASHVHEGDPVQQTGPCSRYRWVTPCSGGSSTPWASPWTARAPSTPQSAACWRPRPRRWCSAGRCTSPSRPGSRPSTP